MLAGIDSNLANANYNFGSRDAKTVFEAIGSADNNNQTGTAGTSATGLNLAQATKLAGNLEFTAIQGQDGQTNNSGNGGAGGAATGIALTNGQNITLSDANITFTSITAGNGGATNDISTNTGGAGGAATGILLKTGDVTVSGTGKIIFKSITAGTGGKQSASNRGSAKAGGNGADGDAYVINNGTGNLTFGDGVSIITSANQIPNEGSFSIYNAIDSRYAFGTKTQFTVQGANGEAANTNKAQEGEDVAGIIVHGAKFIQAGGALTQVVTGGNGGAGKSGATGNLLNGANGGIAAGLVFDTNSTYNLEANSATFTVKGGAGGAGDQKDANNKGTSGAGGDAFGIIAQNGASTLDLTNGSMTFTIKGGAAGSDTKANASTNGDATGILVQGESSTATAKFALNGTNTLKLQVGDKASANLAKNGNAYGIKLVNGEFSGSKAINFDGTDSWVAANTTDGKAYAIYSEGTSAFNSTVIVKDFGDTTGKGLIGKDTYALYNKGDLTLGADAKIVVGADATGADSNLSAKASTDTLNVMLDAGSTTTFNGATGIGGAGKVKLTMGENATLNFEKTGISSSGKVDITTGAGSTLNFGGVAFSNTGAANLTVGAGSVITFNGKAFADNSKANLTLNGAAATKTEPAKQVKLIFNADAGKLNTLKGSNADILLSGDEKEAKARVLADSFVGRTLTIADMQLTNSNFVLAATTKTMQSDQVVITGSTTAKATAPINNTLYIVTDGYALNADKPVTLATVAKDANDKVTFNNLKEDNQTTDTTVYSGFATAEVKIKREADKDGGSKYTSNLAAAHISVNSDFVAPTTAALSTGISLFSANLNSLSKRMGELRNDPYSQGAWARVFAGEMTTDFGGKQSTVYSTIQAGYDYKLGFDNAANYMGVAISYTKGSGSQVNPASSKAPAELNNLPIAGLSSSNTNGVEVALYNSYVSASGLYSDTIAKFGYYMNDLTMFGQTETYKTNNFAAAISEELGYKVSLGENNEWFITPQGEVAFGYIAGTEFTQKNVDHSALLKSTQDAVSLLRARVGAAWGYDFSYLAKESNLKASIYLGTYYTYDYS